jgi:hypothetical protein
LSYKDSWCLRFLFARDFSANVVHEMERTVMKRSFAVLALVAGSFATGQDGPRWQTQTIKDPFLNTELTQYRLEGKYLAAPSSGSATPAMYLRCNPTPHGKYYGKLEDAFLFVGETIVDSHVSYDHSSRVAIQYRLDDGKVHTNSLAHSPDYMMISLQPWGCGECLLNDFFYGHDISHRENTSPQIKKLVVSIPEYRGGNVVIQFDLPDVTEVAKTCGVTYHK